jgi:hypothetical protein
MFLLIDAILTFVRVSHGTTKIESQSDLYTLVCGEMGIKKCFSSDVGNLDLDSFSRERPIK